MSVGDTSFPEMFPVAGCELATASAGVRYSNRDDLLVMAFDEGAEVVGSFTQNSFSAAPVILCREHILAPIRALIVNSGNANACTGDEGIEAARATCQAVAKELRIDLNQVLPFSTGVIGELLPYEKIVAATPELVRGLRPDHWERAAKAIMTTDTYPKGYSSRVDIEGTEITISGISKGAGMIRPNMATMLAYIVTDAAIAPNVLQQMHNSLVNLTFNRVSVDGDSSTNDSAILVATGKAGNPLIENAESEAGRAIYSELRRAYQKLAQDLVRDGEGATKFVTVRVNGGADAKECLAVGYAVVESPLVKTAIFASDPNWGRIVCAIGYSDIEGLDASLVDVYLDSVQIVANGQRARSYEEARGAEVFARDEFTIHIELGRGEASETLWTSDLSYEYVRINADYRT